MSNSPISKEQNVVIELTPSQQDPATANPNDFKINNAGIEPAVPARGQWGDTASEYRALCKESESDPGKSQIKPIAERNTAHTK